jgi:phage gpG-like protein
MVGLIALTIESKKKKSKKLTRFTGQFAANARMGIDAATTILEAEVKKQLSLGGTVDRREGAVPVPNVSDHLRIGDGTLRSSWQSQPAKVILGGKNVEGKVSSNVPYARIHEYGGITSSHIIKPRHAKALRFFVDGEPVFAFSVHHPGSNIPERPYAKPAIEKKRVAMRKAIMAKLLRPLK